MKMGIKGWACKKEPDSLRDKIGLYLWNNNHKEETPE
jgi:hypothetical protein